MEDYESIACENMKTANNIIRDMNIFEICRYFGYKANLIGSVSTGLLMNNLDIDYHLYSDSFEIETIYRVIGRIAKNQKIVKTSCFNYLENEDKSLDWHLYYLDAVRRNWRIDIIFLMDKSPYVGKAEKISEIINTMLNDSIKNRILKLKWDASKMNLEYKGIEIYKAVIENDIKTITEFIKWKESDAFPKANLWEIDPHIPMN